MFAAAQHRGLPPARAAVADAPGELCCGTSFLITREMSTAIAELRVYPSRLSGGVQEAWDRQQGMEDAGWVRSPPSAHPSVLLGASWVGRGEHGQQTELGMCSERQSRRAAQPWMSCC